MRRRKVPIDQCARPGCAATAHASAAGRSRKSGGGRADEVVAGWQAKDPILAAIVRLVPAGGGELALAADELIALHGDDRARQRLAVLVDDASGDHAAPGQAEVDVGDRLRLGDDDRAAGLERAALAVDAVDKAGLRRVDGVIAGAELIEAVAPLLVGRCRPSPRPPPVTMTRARFTGRPESAVSTRPEMTAVPCGPCARSRGRPWRPAPSPRPCGGAWFGGASWAMPAAMVSATSAASTERVGLLIRDTTPEAARS